MNSLDRKIELFAQEEPDAASVQEAQRKLEQALATAQPARPNKARVAGWVAAAASALVAVFAAIWLPLHPSTALAFSDVQQQLRDFSTLRFEFEQRALGRVLMTGRVSVREDGSVRTEVGEDIVTIVNMPERKILTLVKSARVATVSPIAEAGTKEDAVSWLQEIRDFQGMARELSQTRLIQGQRAHGWELDLAEGKVVLWTNDAGLPLEMQLDQGVDLEVSFRFEFEPPLPAELFSTSLPAGYTLQATED